VAVTTHSTITTIMENMYKTQCIYNHSNGNQHGLNQLINLSAARLNAEMPTGTPSSPPTHQPCMINPKSLPTNSTTPQSFIMTTTSALQLTKMNDDCSTHKPHQHHYIPLMATLD